MRNQIFLQPVFCAYEKCEFAGKSILQRALLSLLHSSLQALHPSGQYGFKQTATSQHHCLLFSSNMLYEVLSWKLSLKEALLSHSHSSLLASIPQWPHFDVFCCSLCLMYAPPLSEANRDDKEHPSSWQLLMGLTLTALFNSKSFNRKLA